MIVVTKVRTSIDTNFIVPACKSAEHKMAVQAERDTRPFVPKRTGKLVNSAVVRGNTITWSAPYVRVMYWNHKMVDPETKIAGFPTKDGWKSRAGVKKVRADMIGLRNSTWNYRTGGERWFQKSEQKNIGRWLRIAEREIALHGNK